MTIYITQGCFSRDAMKGFIAKPEDRAKEVQKLMEAAGAKLLDYFITFGEYDFLVISESKESSPTNMTAALIAVGAGGGVSSLRTTVAMRSSDAVKAMKKAKDLSKGFRSAGS